MSLFFWFDLFLEARAEILEKMVLNHSKLLNKQINGQRARQNKSLWCLSRIEKRTVELDFILNLFIGIKKTLLLLNSILLGEKKELCSLLSVKLDVVKFAPLGRRYSRENWLSYSGAHMKILVGNTFLHIHKTTKKVD